MSQAIRSFIALEIPKNIQGQIRAEVNKLKPMIPGVRWVNPENMHLTLKFLGEIDTEHVAKVKAICSQVVPIHTSFILSLSGLGAFPNVHKARVVWTAFAGEVNSLTHLQQHLDKKLAEAGFHPDERPFKPHLTLCRLKNQKLDQKAMNYIRDSKFVSDPFKVGPVVLMRSDLHQSGPVYQHQADFPFMTISSEW